MRCHVTKCSSLQTLNFLTLSVLCAVTPCSLVKGDRRLYCSLLFKVKATGLNKCLYIDSFSSSSSAVTSQDLTDPFRPRPIISPKVFQVVFVHSVYNSTLFLPSCCCSFLLHVVANLICILLVCRQLFLLSALPKFLHFFLWSKRV